MLLALVSLAVPAGLVSAAPTSTLESQTIPHWQGPLLEGPVEKLITFADGTLLAQRVEDVQESNDGGQTWSEVPLPAVGPSPRAQFVGADHTDETVLFATGDSPLYKTTNGGATWRPILTQGQLNDLKRASEISDEPAGQGGRFRALAVVVSPADHRRAYAEVAWSYADRVGYPADDGRRYPPYGLLSSTDAGETWTLVQKVGYGTLCYVEVLLLLPHPTNPERLFSDTDCLAGRNRGSYLEQSVDGGRTLAPFWDESGVFRNQRGLSICRGGDTTYGYPRTLVGGEGVAPARLYLAVNRDRRYGGSTILRSDDDGASWQAIIAYRGGGSPECTDVGDWNVQIAGLAYDPADPDRLYVARLAHSGDYPYPVVTSGIAMTTDAGATWTDVASQQMGLITDLVLGPHALTLFAATDQGVWQLEVPRVP